MIHPKEGVGANIFIITNILIITRYLTYEKKLFDFLACLFVLKSCVIHKLID